MTDTLLPAQSGRPPRPPILDLHTHRGGRPDAILSVAPADAVALRATAQPQPYSIALHPWTLRPDSVAAFLRAVDVCQGDERLRAIGECGLDPAGSLPEAEQRAAFEQALGVARRLCLPVVVHCVKWWGLMGQSVRHVWGGEGARRAWDDGCPVIVHGFRKGPVLARQLLAAGFGISLGEHFHPDVARLLPADHLFTETDESAVSIDAIRARIFSLRP